MRLPENALIWCVLIVCLTLLIFTYLIQAKGREQGGRGSDGLRIQR
jgi:hypothetical protein